MRSRRERRKHLKVEHHLEAIDDDLDDGDDAFKGLRHENRALMLAIVIAVIASGIWL